MPSTLSTPTARLSSEAFFTSSELQPPPPLSCHLSSMSWMVTTLEHTAPNFYMTCGPGQHEDISPILLLSTETRPPRICSLLITQPSGLDNLFQHWDGKKPHSRHFLTVYCNNYPVLLLLLSSLTVAK